MNYKNRISKLENILKPIKYGVRIAILEDGEEFPSEEEIKRLREQGEKVICIDVSYED